MDVVRPEFVPDPSSSREEMEALQREIRSVATFEDDYSFPTDPLPVGSDAPVVVGVDQAFIDDSAISALVAMRDGEVIERIHAVTPCSTPYIPGLLAFREGGPILAAFDRLSVDPDVAILDGSGRIHYRQAGIATHVGVVLDVPSVGVAKRLLCGRLVDPPPQPLRAGTRVRIEADDRVDAPNGTLLGYAVQTKQYASGNRHVNPVYVSPGHRVRAETAADLTEALCAGYKLPEPVRLADAHAAEVKAGRSLR